MGKLFKLIVLFLIWPVIVQAGQKEKSLFKRGNQLYQKQKYTEAISVYRKLLQNSQKNPDVYQNLGSAYFRVGNLGQATWCYQKAIWLDPLNAEIIQNQELVKDGKEKELAGLSIDLNPVFLVPFIKAGLFLGSAALLLSSFFFLGSVLSKSSGFNRKLKLMSLILSITGLLALGIVLGGYFYLKPAPNSMVILKAMQSKAGPSLEAKVAVNFKEGDLVRWQNYYRGWYKVARETGESGWVRAEILGKVVE